MGVGVGVRRGVAVGVVFVVGVAMAVGAGASSSFWPQAGNNTSNRLSADNRRTQFFFNNFYLHIALSR